MSYLVAYWMRRITCCIVKEVEVFSLWVMLLCWTLLCDVVFWLEPGGWGAKLVLRLKSVLSIVVLETKSRFYVGVTLSEKKKSTRACTQWKQHAKNMCTLKYRHRRSPTFIHTQYIFVQVKWVIAQSWNTT